MTDTGTEARASRADELRAAQRRFLFPCVGTYYSRPLVLREGRGCRVRDEDGVEYLDGFAGILSTSIGHCHPHVVEAVSRQAASLGHVSTLYVNEPQVEAARRLAEIAPGDLDVSFFTNSGTEAVETAVMLACMHTGRSEVITLRHAYSGRSILATNLTAHAAWRPMPSSIAGIKHVAAPYPYRAPIQWSSERELVDFYIRDLEEAIETTTNGRPAAFMAETILGVGGFIVPPNGYFQEAARLVRSYGGLFICDEVQAGFGRTGSHWFGIEHWDVVPDIMVMAKGIANGLPAAATTTTPEIAGSFDAKTISTFGGNPISMAAACATMDVMAHERVAERAAERGAQLEAGLRGLHERYGWIGEVRGMGLMMALELVRDRDGKVADPTRAGALLDAAREEGLLIGLGGLAGQVVRIGPSLLISDDEVDELLERLGRACERVDDE